MSRARRAGRRRGGHAGAGSAGRAGSARRRRGTAGRAPAGRGARTPPVSRCAWCPPPAPRPRAGGHARRGRVEQRGAVGSRGRRVRPRGRDGARGPPWWRSVRRGRSGGSQRTGAPNTSNAPSGPGRSTAGPGRGLCGIAHSPLRESSSHSGGTAAGPGASGAGPSGGTPARRGVPARCRRAVGIRRQGQARRRPGGGGVGRGGVGNGWPERVRLGSGRIEERGQERDAQGSVEGVGVRRALVRVSGRYGAAGRPAEATRTRPRPDGAAPVARRWVATGDRRPPTRTSRRRRDPRVRLRSPAPSAGPGRRPDGASSGGADVVPEGAASGCSSAGSAGADGPPGTRNSGVSSAAPGRPEASRLLRAAAQHRAGVAQRRGVVGGQRPAGREHLHRRRVRRPAPAPSRAGRRARPPTVRVGLDEHDRARQRAGRRARGCPAPGQVQPCSRRGGARAAP